MGEMICTGLRAAKGSFTLDVAHLGLRKGEKVALLGENGCGKTTLLQSLAGLVPITGEITCDGVSWTALSAGDRSRKMAYLPQETEVLFNLTVREITELSLHDAELLQGDERLAVLRATEMTAFQNRVYPSLSGGEKRRAMLARIFCRRADFILLDEPTGPLDMRHAGMVMRHAKAADAAVIAATHDLNLAVRYFERFLLMQNGRILFDLRKNELDAGGLEKIYGIGFACHGDHFIPLF